MDPFNSTYNYKARLDRISIDKSSEPIKNEATLLLKKQKVLPADDSAGSPSTAQHWMEVHVDGRLMVRYLSCIGVYGELSADRTPKAHWHLDQLVRQSSVAAPGLLARSFYSFRLEKIIQVVLPLPMPVEQNLLASSSQPQNPVSDLFLFAGPRTLLTVCLVSSSTSRSFAFTSIATKNFILPSVSLPGMQASTIKKP